MPDRMPQGFQQRQHRPKCREISINEISQMQREWQLLRCQPIHRRLQLGDGSPVVALAVRLGIGLLHIRDQPEGEQRLGRRNCLSPDFRNGSRHRRGHKKATTIHKSPALPKSLSERDLKLHP